MRSLMLALGACLFALNFAGCSSTGPCGGSCGGQRLLGGGNIVGHSGCSGCSESSCGDSSCSGGCGNTGCATAFANKNYGGQTGLGLGLMEAGPSCEVSGCNGGCQACRQRLQLPTLQRPHLASRLAGRIASSGCGGGSDCGCGTSGSAPAGDCGCGVPAPAVPESDCGCSASSSVEFSMSDSVEDAYEQEGEVQLASHLDRRGLFGHFGLGSRKHTLQGCGARGCGGRGGLCSNCLSRLHGGAGGGLGLGAGAGRIPHRDPNIHSGGGAAGPAGQIPTYAYPYYTTRAPRDFLDPNPPTIGY